MSRRMMQFHGTQNAQHCIDHLKLLNNTKEIQQKEREAWVDGLHLGHLENSRPDVFQVYGKLPG